MVLRGDMTDLRAELRGEMADLRAELRGEMAELRAELRGEMQELRAELKIEMAEGFQRQIKWMVGSMIGMFTAFSAVAGVLLAIFK
jgi:predicted  nucleic acid-binding Zn-ribbon protein